MNLGSKSRRGFITGGTWCADHNKLVRDWPKEEEVVEIIEENVRGGGSACNLAIDLKRLDPKIPVSTIGLLGEDEDGRLLIQEALAAGLDTTFLKRTELSKTQRTDAYTASSSGRRTHLYFAGTAAHLTPDHFDFTKSNARFFHLGLPGVHEKLDKSWDQDPNGWVTVLKKAKTEGIITNLELCSISAKKIYELVKPCLQFLDLLIVNDFEICAISGMELNPEQPTDFDACKAAARDVLRSGTMHLVAVHFPEGAFAYTRDGNFYSHPSVAIPETAIIGTNGAGDAFAAGFLYALHENMGIETAIITGHAAAAASVRGIGTSDKVESFQRSREIANKWGWRDAF